MLVLLLHLAEPREDPIEIAGARRVRHGVLQLLQLVMKIAGAAAAQNRFVEDRSSGHLLDVLTEVADRQPLRHRDVAFVRRFFADDHAEERRLAGSVRADEPDLLAWIELKRGVDEQDLLPVLLADPRERDHSMVTVVL